MVLLADGNLDDYKSIGQLDAEDWFVVGAGDYNGDQQDDLLVRQYSTGMLGYYRCADQDRWVLPLRRPGPLGRTRPRCGHGLDGHRVTTHSPKLNPCTKQSFYDCLFCAGFLFYVWRGTQSFKRWKVHGPFARSLFWGKKRRFSHLEKPKKTHLSL